MTETDIALVRASFARVFLVRRILIASFWSHLFEAAPDLRSLAEGDLAGHSDRVFRFLSLMVEHLDDPDAFDRSLASFLTEPPLPGAKPEHAAVLNEALLFALAHNQPQGMDAETAAAWRAALALALARSGVSETLTPA